TLLIEIASVDAAVEEARLAERLAVARSEAEVIIADAGRQVDEMLARAAAEAESLLATAQAEAHELSAELDSRATDLGGREEAATDRALELEGREQQLRQREKALDARGARLQEDEKAASAALAAARVDAEAILEEARITADGILEEARDEAKVEAQAIRDEAEQTRHDAAAARIEEIERVHRVELGLLHDRERELLGKVDELERRLAHAAEHRAPRTEVDASEVPAGPSDVEEAATDEAQTNGRHSADRRIEVHSNSESIGSNGSGGNGGVGITGGSNGGGSLSTHAPLTEQLSTSAFRTVSDKERRGRRRR
ncbi:MAG TPA: hypothetical protein VLB67_05415, partial [Acidimicrobiia bacterium]|nr:hypothetical protein [Acidimicrobiia bacterium]